MEDVNEYGINKIYRIAKTICQSCLSNNDNMVFHAIYSSHTYKKKSHSSRQCGKNETVLNLKSYIA